MQSLHSLVRNISHSFLSAAPEILHKGQCASAADMYSLGMVFTACFNGGQAVIQASHSTSNYFKLAGQVRQVTQTRHNQSQSQSAIEIRVPWSCCQPQYTYPGLSRSSHLFTTQLDCAAKNKTKDTQYFLPALLYCVEHCSQNAT